ncbi:integrase arm-type DNA-binding domain-containing protein [Roseomonas sp. HF4]|uniref:tyrosine-type recombinase/integrase n=1 Tax=Roseomonas sp. HF4 TaxID=2562313 RepID=UPI0010BFFF28|nr:integrase arm-type DNA-binding domain-containing protein [Roseomonas sp. HF4]
MSPQRVRKPAERPSRLRLSDAVVEAAICPPGRKDVLLFDADLRGFAVRVTRTGGKTFLLQYRVGGIGRRAVIGTWGEITTAKARKSAETLRGAVRDHRDPVAERRQRLAEQRAAEARAKAEASAAEAAGAFTVERLIAHWTELRLSERSASYRARAPRDMRRAFGTWCAAPAADLDRTAAVGILDEVKSKQGPVAANRLRAVASACWSWALKRGSLAENPWKDTERPAAEAARERVLTDAEVGALWTAAGALDAPWGGLVRTLLLTGQRRSEVAGMMWTEIDIDSATWSLPAARVKNRHAHTVPLSAQMLDVLQAQPRFRAKERGAGLVFRGARGTAPSGFGRVKVRLDKAMAKAAKEAGRP